jgi:hypothetical protein
LGIKSDRVSYAIAFIVFAHPPFFPVIFAFSGAQISEASVCQTLALVLERNGTEDKGDGESREVYVPSSLSSPILSRFQP